MNTKQPEAFAGADILDRVDDLRRSLDGSYRDTIVEAIYEEDFLDCSYGFRPKRSAMTPSVPLTGSFIKAK